MEESGGEREAQMITGVGQMASVNPGSAPDELCHPHQVSGPL